MRERREPLCVRVSEDRDERYRREREREPVQHAGRDEEQDDRTERERADKTDADVACRERAHGGPRVLGVDVAVDEPVERHRGASGADHGDGDPEQRAKRRDAARRRHRAEQRERQGKERVLDLDHLERDAEAVEG